MGSSIIQLTMKCDQITDEMLMNLAQTLRMDLLEIDDLSVEFSSKENRHGSKGWLTIDWDTLLITFLASGGILTTIISTIQAWLLRNQGSSVTLKLGDDELTIAGTGPYSSEQEKAINLWLSRNKGFVFPND